MARAAGANPRRIQSIEVGFRLIQVLEAAAGAISLKDLARGASMPASKAHPYMMSFVGVGLAEQDPTTGRYTLGRFGVQLGLSALRQLDILSLARGVMAELSAETGWSAHLAIWGNRGPTVVSTYDGPNDNALALRVGQLLPVVRSATGKIFHAFLAADVLEPVLRAERAAAGDPSSWDKAAALIDEPVRRSGHATTPPDYTANVFAAAAPVFDHQSGLAGVLTVMDWYRPIPESSRTLGVRRVIAAGRSLSHLLGAPPELFARFAWDDEDSGAS
jgi:DNA-binding IclR family transcriptional regulator